MSVGRIFVYANIALISGIIFGSIVISPSLLLYIIGSLILIAGFYVLFRSHSLLLGVLCVLFCAFGFLRTYDSYLTLIRAHTFFANRAPIELTGEVVALSENDQGSRRAIIKTDQGRQIFFTFDTQVKRGSFVQVTCEIVDAKLDFGEYATSGSNATCIKSTLRHAAESERLNYLEQLRGFFNNKLHRLMPSPESALAQGILLGEKQSMPEDLKESFRRTGTSHIVVLSGYNITILAVVLLNIFRRMRFSLRLSIGICLLFIVIFVLLTGIAAPSVRAALMVSVIFLARMRGRQSSGMYALIFSASLMLFLSPFVLGWSLSFQLSFLATLGLLASERLSRFTRWIPDRFGLQENAKTTLAATLCTLPLVAYQFGAFPLIGLLVNCIVLPFIPFAMALSALALLLSFFSYPAAFFFGVIPYSLLHGILSLIDFFSSFSFATVATNQFSPFILLLSYTCLSVLFIAGGKKQKISDRKTKKVPTTILFGALTCVLVAIVFFRTDNTKVLFFNVGQGDASLIHLHKGYDMLIDAGPDRTILSRLGQNLSYFNRTIERVVITHPHADHIGGLTSVLEKYEVHEVLITDVDYQSYVYTSILDTLRKKNIPVRIVSVTEKNFEQNEKVPLEIFWPRPAIATSDINDTSIVFRTRVMGVSFIFMGDAGEKIEEELLKINPHLQSDILKVGHHGSKTASSKEFLKKVHPFAAIISVGAENKYGHPDQTTLQRLSGEGITALRTDVCGTVEVVLNSKNEANIRSGCDLDK